MKRILLSILKNTANFSQTAYDRYASDHTPEEPPYQSLSPINNAVNIDHYTSALQWALKNRKSKDIKNIAITGPYGSGKSSILRTFQQHNKTKGLFFLPISLATFKEESPRENGKDGKGGGEDMLRLIELSILQQIFYHEEDGKIPDSRFKKIKNFKRINLWLASIGIMTLIVATFYLFAPAKVMEIAGISTASPPEAWLRYTALISVLLGCFIIILKSTRTMYSVSINKLKIQNAEIEIGKNVNKSILNNHLDEILYFFEVTKYNVVVIEDLDRFEQTDIFTKLREINLLINNSQKIKRDVVFIYTVRDEMFQDKDRTKFFDFIIPVIPVINASNSNEILKKIISQHQYAVAEELIEDVSLFIDDMRLLYNICNEYHIYHKSLDQNLNQTKLLAMIVYKNLHPKDFVLLGHSKGDLYNVFADRSSWLKSYTNDLDRQIHEYTAKIKTLHSSIKKEKTDLRRGYINAYLTALPNSISFQINGEDQNLDTLLTDDNFDHLIQDRVTYTYANNESKNQNISSQYKVLVKFADIEKKVDPKLSYREKERQIVHWNSDKIETAKDRIKELETEKSKSWHLKVSEIITKGSFPINTADEKRTQLLKILLRNGYIAEDYLDYISIFYPESITKEDRYFLLNVKSYVQTDFDFKLNRIDKLLAKVSERDFQQRAILNYNLLDYLLENPYRKTVLDAVLSQLCDPSTLVFVLGFIDKGVNVSPFIHEMCKRWPDMWRYIESSAAVSDDKKRIYFGLILGNAATSDIAGLAQRSNLKTYIETEKGLLNSIENIETRKSVVKELNIKFSHLDSEMITPELADFIYSGNFYKLTPQTVETVIRERGFYDKTTLETSNYQAIKKSGCISLIDYVSANINGYIANVYLKIASNTKEPEEYLIELFNDISLTHTHKAKIMDQTLTIIKDIRQVTSPMSASLLLSKSRIAPTWTNLTNYYRSQDSKIDEHLITFLNNPNNIATLSAEKIVQDQPATNKHTVSIFLYTLLTTDSLNNDSYESILRVLPKPISSLPFEKISREKLTLLIKYQVLLLTPKNYLLLKRLFPDLHLALLEGQFTDFLEKPNVFPLSEDDVKRLLHSSKISAEEKKALNEIIGKIKDDDNPES